ncbi:serine protease, partial [Streptomyces sp. MB09-02B]|nr:serine protease [Streptomyces sp. MB09-02B]
MGDGFAASGGWAASDFTAASAASAGVGGGEHSSGEGVGRPWLPGRYEGELGDIRPERLARLAEAEGRPLLLLLDGPEEMPPALAHRLAEWTAGTAEWLRANGARLVVACRAEYWERAGAHFPAELLHGEGHSLPACVRLGDLTESEARRARLRYGIPEDALTAADARHPLTLRLLSEVRAALPDAPNGRPGEDGAFAGPPAGHAAGAAWSDRSDEAPEDRVPGPGDQGPE